MKRTASKFSYKLILSQFFGSQRNVFYVTVRLKTLLMHYFINIFYLFFIYLQAFLFFAHGLYFLYFLYLF